MYVVASKYSRTHFVYDKYKTVQSFNLHFLQNNPLVQQYTSASDWKAAGKISRSRLVKAFSALPSHSYQ
jgi:hypothetical protein